MISPPPIKPTHGRCWTNRLQRYQKVRSRLTTWRCGSGVRNERPNGAKLIAITTAATANAANSATPMFSPVKIPIRARITNTAVPIAAAREVLSIRLPTKPNNAGSKVTAASIITNTENAPAIASPRTKAMPTTINPSKLIITVSPAKITARPDVLTAATAASSGDSPRCRCSR